MQLTQDNYNKPTGKISLLSKGELAYTVPNGVTCTGDVNVDTGTTFTIGTDISNKYFGILTRWSQITTYQSTPVHIKWTPTDITLPACMIAIYAEFEGATTDVWDGSGEVAIYGRFSTDESDVRLLMWTGVGQSGSVYSSGWMTPNDGTQAFIIHTRDVFSNPDLSGYSWADVKDLRLVMKNQDSTKKCRIRNFYIYEAVTSGPSGSGTVKSATPTSITYTLTASGAQSAVDASLRAGTIYMESPFYRVTDYTTGTTSVSSLDISPAKSTYVNEDITFTYPGIGRTEWIKAYDGYGNLGYITGTYGAKTTINTSFVATPDNSMMKLTATTSTAGPKLRDYAFYHWTIPNGSASAEWVPISRAIYDPLETLPKTMTCDYALDYTGGGRYRACLNAEALIPDTDPVTQEVTNNTYYFGADTILDSNIPTILGFSAQSASGSVVLTTKAEDIHGIASVEYYSISDSQPQLIATHTFSSPYPTILEDSYTTVGTPGSQIGFLAKVYDQPTNLFATSETLQVQITGGDDIITAETMIIPEARIIIRRDGHVHLSWDPWKAFLPAVGGYRYPAHTYKIYRKTEESGTYTCISGELDGYTYEYDDTTITAPAKYIYALVGTDNFGNAKSIEIVADLVSVLSKTTHSFIEDYLRMLPSWTAAVPKVKSS